MRYAEEHIQRVREHSLYQNALDAYETVLFDDERSVVSMAAAELYDCMVEAIAYDLGYNLDVVSSIMKEERKTLEWEHRELELGQEEWG